MPINGWHKADIIAAVKKKTGLSLTKLSVKHELHKQACQQALHRPYLKAEIAISTAIGTPVYVIWPDRYNTDGSRKKSLYSKSVTNKRKVSTFKQSDGCAK